QRSQVQENNNPHQRSARGEHVIRLLVPKEQNWAPTHHALGSLKHLFAAHVLRRHGISFSPRIFCGGMETTSDDDRNETMRDYQWQRRHISPMCTTGLCCSGLRCLVTRLCHKVNIALLSRLTT